MKIVIATLAILVATFGFSTVSQADEAFRAEVIRLTNIERANNGLGALTAHNQLGRAAQKHALSMACLGYFSHTGSDGSDLRTRADREGYTGLGLGENIAAGQTTPAQVVNGWMNSPGHRDNILDGSYTAIGVGHTGDTWVQVFGTSTAGAGQGDNGSGLTCASVGGNSARATAIRTKIKKLKKKIRLLKKKRKFRNARALAKKVRKLRGVLSRI